jgi:mRNA-degrading endonuclease RelE of RelBE toxin-antitoxin system
VAPPRTFRIELDRGSERDFQQLPQDVQETVLLEIQRRLTTEPFKEIKTRIKRLSGLVPPLYRLRVGDYRAYYRIAGDRVVILAILHKKDSERWLRPSNKIRYRPSNAVAAFSHAFRLVKCQMSSLTVREGLSSLCGLTPPCFFRLNCLPVYPGLRSLYQRRLPYFHVFGITKT